MFLAPWFALAGLAAAAGPVLIHLLNRRRYRVVPWGAMDFLREAIFRNRRIMQLRDLLLLALRTICILLFGLAMAQPFLGKSVVGIGRDQPIHAVLLLDNSLSMGYRYRDATLLDEAKTRAKQLIEELPRGSRISVLPICGATSGKSGGGISYTPYYTKEDALEALAMIEPLDRAAVAGAAVDLAQEACDRAPDMAAKKIVLLTDQQVADWPTESLRRQLAKLPGPIEVVQLKPEVINNAWISDFRLRDGVADRQTSGVFLARVRYEGPEVQGDVQVALSVDGLTFDEQSIELRPGQTREVEFAPYRFENPQGDDRFRFAAAEVSVTLRLDGAAQQDGLPADDRRFLVVPVVERLPVVFVDQWGENEQPQQNRYGETYHLRQLLAPSAAGAQRQRQLVAVRHVRIDEVGRDLLEDARLVVIAGVASPQPAVSLLRQYVEQGGNLVIAAGGHFDPALWTTAAWQDGLGILPAPLSPVTFGQLPEESQGALMKTFQFDYHSMKNHDYFLLEGASDEEMQDLYRLPYFFKTVQADVDDEVKATMVAATEKHLKQRREDLAEIQGRLAELSGLEAKQELSPAQRSQRDDLQGQRAQLEPAWLLWGDRLRSEAGRPFSSGSVPVEELAQATKFSVLARYTNGLPYMIQRRIGRGKVLLVTSGVFSSGPDSWNTLSLTNTVLIFDRILRGMLRQTVADRTVSAQRPYELPVAAAQRSARITLARITPGDPDDAPRQLSVDPLGAGRYGVTLDDLTRRGHYRVTALRGERVSQQGAEEKLWEIPLAVNGPAEESELISPEEAELRRGRGFSPSDSLSAGVFSVAGFQPAQLQGTDLWKWIMVAVLAGLLLELLILAWPSMSVGRVEARGPAPIRGP